MSDFLTPSDIESILQDSRWSGYAREQYAVARCPAQSRPLPGTACHEINFKGGRHWMSEERPGKPAWWRFWA